MIASHYRNSPFWKQNLITRFKMYTQEPLYNLTNKQFYKYINKTFTHHLHVTPVLLSTTPVHLNYNLN